MEMEQKPSRMPLGLLNSSNKYLIASNFDVMINQLDYKLWIAMATKMVEQSAIKYSGLKVSNSSFT